VVQDVTERRRIQEENERRARQLTVLHETSVELTAELNQNALFQSIAQHALDRIEGSKSVILYIKAVANVPERIFAWKIER
jgi:hypothetical protein